ncbi:emp24/gp25L/p24 family protein [Polaromonas sp. AER18D-145]|uniref:emp24/gp25L/p24 family protein n=1 Tax=Polaromonas sp. AER18D-145 TaxID=1977060 RepID=UPI000BBC3712|nr:emp24/gp25L/p24 family protein [Polaromonas sp. AER18D-145]
MNTFLHPLPHRALLTGGLWLCLSAGALAVTLGPSTRSAVLGQPLDLSMQLMLDTGDDPQALCLEADVFYVDKPLDKASVRITPEKGATAQDWLVHIRSATPVEGPVVTVHLRAGCVQKTIRRYVVLAATKPRAVGASLQTTLAAADPQPLSAGAPPAQSAVAGTADGNKVQTLEAELRQLRADMMRNQAALAENRHQLEQAENARFGKVVVYGLAALCSLAVMGLLFVLYLRSTAQAAGTVSSSEHSTFSPESGLSTGLPMAAASRTADLDVNESLFDELRRASRYPAADSIPSLPPRDRPRFSVSVPFVPRTVKVPELFDLQQQVEFFSSLGQQANAIALLRKHLVDNVKTSALIYLDLLDLYHQTGNVQDYEDLRDDVNKVFNTRIVPFDRYVPASAGGAAYATILLQIQAAWPTRQVFRIIEEALFREPGDGAEVLALEEYRELLLLYAVGREIIELESGSVGRGGDTQWPDLAMQPRSSPRLGLDIDLTRLSDGSDSKPADNQATARTPSTGRASRMEPVRADSPASLAELPHAARRRDGQRTGAASPLSIAPNSVRPTGLDSLVDFDDYDTGYRPDDVDKSRL